MAAIFVAMFVVLYAVYYTSMQKLIVEREQQNMTSQVKLAENMLTSSVSALPGITQDWATWDLSYAYTNNPEGGADFETEYLDPSTYDLYRLDFITILDTDGDKLYEGFFDHASETFSTEPLGLGGLYEKVFPQVLSSYDENKTDMGVSGFINYDNNIYYLSSYPVIRSNGGGPVAGVLIFGRLIDERETALLTSDAGIDFSVQPRDTAGISHEDDLRLTAAGTLLTENEDLVTAYSALKDAFGEKNLLVSVSMPETYFTDSGSSFTVILLVLALCCGVMLIVVVNLVNSIVINPMGKLIYNVNDMNLDSADLLLDVKNNTKELDDLTGAMNNMLARIKHDRDVIKKHSDELYYNANFDLLTGLRNRFSIAKELDEEIAKSKAENASLTLYFIDLNRFKFINDTLGATMGDQFIVSVSRRLQEEFENALLIGRMGGDEFIIIVKNLDRDADRRIFSSNILNVFKKPFYVREREMHITASIGASAYPKDGLDAEMLISNAEIAMYRAKDSGDSVYVAYEHKFQTALQRKIYLEHKIRDVIHEDCKEFRAYFQPKILSTTGEIRSCEALIRWMAPEGMISPAELIPQAEESGLIVPLSWWMIRESCRQCKQFEKHGIVNSVAINLSAQVLLHEDFLDVLLSAADEFSLDTSRIDIEITESTIMDDIDKINTIFKKLHDLNVEISVDDFGTGYSSLSYLNKLAVDRIKIDRSFIMGINDDEESRAIIKAIVAMAKSLNITVTAEGVEDEVQFEFLKQVRCDELQGFLFSKPVSADRYVRFMKKWQEAKNN